jgi:hypothetical protein
MQNAPASQSAEVVHIIAQSDIWSVGCVIAAVQNTDG